MILPNAVKSISSKLSKIFSIEAVNLLKVEESIISAREGGKKLITVHIPNRKGKLKNMTKDKLKCYLRVLVLVHKLSSSFAFLFSSFF